MLRGTEQERSNIDIDSARASFRRAYDAWADQAYGYAVAVTPSPEAAAELAASAWCSVWERWSAFTRVHQETPGDAWLSDELRCATLMVLQASAHQIPA